MSVSSKGLRAAQIDMKIGSIAQCKFCDTEFSIRTPSGVFCSSKCAQNFFARKRRQTKREVHCAVCSSVFLAKTKRSKFCSAKCKHQSLKPITRDRLLKKAFGITHADYLLLVEKQGNRCAICRSDDPSKFTAGNVNWAVDHDHRTGKIRGLLCSRCNRGLGLFLDDVQIISRAIEYLKESVT